MHTLRDVYPEAVDLPLDKFFEIANMDHMSYILDEISEYYMEHLPMWWVLRHYGIDVEESDDNPVQVNCLWSSHGSSDENASARYFPYERSTGLKHGSVYCYKCGRTRTSVWFTFDMESQRQDFSLTDVFVWIEDEWKIKFPRALFLDFNPDIIIQINETSRQRNYFLFAESNNLHDSGLGRDNHEFRNRLYGILMGEAHGIRA